MESKNLIILIELILWLEIKKARYKTFFLLNIDWSTKLPFPKVAKTKLELFKE